ncbi:MAG: cyclic nucleotide-binding domain-containing protein [Desulfobacterales bacterium]|nr:cyclic nucleotide-binding domain-containing protein [Desulfobacterales bacterium]
MGDVQLGVLDTQRLSREYSSLSSDFGGLLVSLDARLKKVTDRAVELFTKKSQSDGLSKDNKVVIKEGSSKEEVFAIAEGKAHVIRKTPKGFLRLLTLEKGDVFGHVPFVDIGHEPRYASVLASKNFEANKLDADSLQKEYDRLSTAFKILIDNVAICISVTTRLVNYLTEEK